MMHRALTIRVLLALLSALLAGSQLSAQDRKALPVVFTCLAWNSELPFRVALARGFFKGQGLEIQRIFVRGGPMALAALSSGDVNFAEIGGAQAVMRRRARGLEVSIIASIANATTFQLNGGLFAPAFSADLSLNLAAFQFMLDEDKRAGLIDGKFILGRVLNDRIVKTAQQELRAGGRL